MTMTYLDVDVLTLIVKVIIRHYYERAHLVTTAVTATKYFRCLCRLA